MLRFMLLVILVAIAVYLVVQTIQRRGITSLPDRKAPPSRPLGPDDDAAFLRDLDRNRKRKNPEDPE